MCGINGYVKYGHESQEKLNANMSKMNSLIFHRGPDEDGVFTESNHSHSIALAMRRLSIIDLSSGKQPIFSDDKSIVIVFNGEIYNYKELKARLEKLGVSFNTTSDTEVILKLYETFGVESFKELDGMFGFSIYDKNKDKIYIARDFFGEKPLYYYKSNDQFVWASELKSITSVIDKKPAINSKGLNLYFRLTYIPAPYTIYENIHKLKQNHFIEYDIERNNFSIHQIEKETDNTVSKIDIPFDEAKENVKDLVYESVTSRSVSDVPIGTFLSGGVDSSVVSLCLSQHTSKPIDTFSIGFEKKSYDESEKSRVVAKLINSNHHEFIINEKDLVEDVNKILLNFDEPFSDSSSLPTYLVSNRTKDHVKVALTGDGGDEVFGGYNKYYIGKLNTKYTNIVPKSIHNIMKSVTSPFLKTSSDNRGKRFKIKRLLNSIDYNGGEYYWDILSLGFQKNALGSFLLPKYLHEDLFNTYKEDTKIMHPQTLTDFRLIDKVTSLEGDMLVKVDRTSMLNSLECRAPFLNKKIWNYTNTLPEEYLMKGWNKKYILKEAFRDQFPEDFLDKSKSGFGAPVGDWLKSGLRKELESYIVEKELIDQNIFHVDNTIKLVKNHITGKEDNTFKVWTFYCFQKWYYNIYKQL
ncbi:asparagine synthase (glutamine-hydrolyzing) [Hyunsoonleella pacifica]|uniref:asparagine synthase (glutamine-hydrolyzing) n=1 Tax=Hyunsoonleella pacifica TaxID=1080224 RepID=A0A4Q9FU62_9FLAO|nr:asparagine synthase (glutamine-hydrolyzing) [Hyunsoonleella pacifica]TBN17659.1 asparagine synthase (glutamine-hydrolyzing) [Hyunsoonleella pacifica]GGD10077.1 asparagine synthetase B [Hyunsoonleella pacifica]